jgi:hypothetical protein
MFKFITNLLSGSLLSGASSLAKIFVGDKSERDAAIAEEVKAVQEAYQAEMMAPERLSVFAQFVDAANRLVRPSFTYGIIALFIWAAKDPIEFTASMVALAAVPEMMWWILLTVISFWFGGRLLEKAQGKFKVASDKQLTQILKIQKELRRLEGGTQEWGIASKQFMTTDPVIQDDDNEYVIIDDHEAVTPAAPVAKPKPVVVVKPVKKLFPVKRQNFKSRFKR